MKIQSSLIVQRLFYDLCIYCAIYMSNIPQKCFCSKRLTLLWSSIESFYIPVLKKLLAHLEIHCPISRFRLFWYKLRTVWNLRYISEGSDDLEQNSYCMNFKTYLPVFHKNDWPQRFASRDWYHLTHLTSILYSCLQKSILFLPLKLPLNWPSVAADD